MNDEKIDIHSIESESSGFYGFLETLCRKYKSLAFILAMFPTAMAYFSCLVISLFPGVSFFLLAIEHTTHLSLPLKGLIFSMTITLGIALFAFLLLMVIPIFNKLIPLKKENWRGNWYSLRVIPWFYHNALVMLARYSVLKYFQSTPVINWFYRRMGMKIGKGCIINSEKIQDPCLIELGDFVTIGGSASIFCHYGQAGYLVIAPVKIGKGTTIGLKASIMGDVWIGENVLIDAHSVVKPKSRIN